jgi:hypothetical protein
LTVFDFELDLSPEKLATWTAAVCIFSSIALLILSVFPFAGSLNDPKGVAKDLMGTGLTLGFGVQAKQALGR